MSTGLILKVLTVHDWKLVKSFRLEALREEPQAFDAEYAEMETREDSYWKEYTKSLVDDGGFGFYTLEDLKVTGIIWAHRGWSSKTQHVVDVDFFFVQKESRGKSVGKTLFQKTIGHIHTLPSIIKVNVRVCANQKSAIALYEKAGFKIVSVMERERFVNGIFYDDLKMSIFL